MEPRLNVLGSITSKILLLLFIIILFVIKNCYRNIPQFKTAYLVTEYQEQPVTLFTLM